MKLRFVIVIKNNNNNIKVTINSKCTFDKGEQNNLHSPKYFKNSHFI